MRRSVIAILVLLVLVVGAGCATVPNTAPSTTPVPPPVVVPVEKKPPVVKAKTWQTVIEFTGNGIKTTQKFTIASDEWMLTWATTPGSFEGNFIVYVNRGNGEMVNVAANVMGKAADTSYFYAAGEFYLEIISTQPYSIIISQYK